MHQKLQISKRGTTYTQGKRDYFALVIALRYLLPVEEFLAYKRKLNALIQKAVQENSQITEKALLSLMGFPENWKKVSSYHKV